MNTISMQRQLGRLALNCVRRAVSTTALPRSSIGRSFFKYEKRRYFQSSTLQILVDHNRQDRHLVPLHFSFRSLLTLKQDLSTSAIQCQLIHRLSGILSNTGEPPPFVLSLSESFSVKWLADKDR